MTNSSPYLSGFSTAITFDEELVNFGPQLLDTGVTFTDLDDNFDGGSLVMRGLLAEDILSVRNQGSGTGQIGYDGSIVTFEGITIGTVTGGTNGTDLSVIFNASATAASIEALIENLTYENLSDTPTPSRELELIITDDEGTVAQQPYLFSVRTNTNNPFNGFDNGAFSSTAFVDMDGDGDLDLVNGEQDGIFNYYENTGTAITPVYMERIGAANPLNGLVASYSSPTFADIDGDGDQDMISGELFGNIFYYENTGTAIAPAFVERTGAANPFDSIDVGRFSTPVFIDLNNDGDQDLVIGEEDGNINYFINAGNALAPFYAQATGVVNPFDGIDIGDHSTISFFDRDSDGDQDLFIGESSGSLNYYENIGTAIAPVYIERTGAANPFSSIFIGPNNTPQFADIDNDGDQDLVIGENNGIINYYKNIPTAVKFSFVEHVGAASPFDGIDVGTRSAPAFSDIDGDGDQDLVIGENGGNLYYYENTGTAMAPVYSELTGATNPFDGISVSASGAPKFSDIDGDGDQDLIIGHFFTFLHYFENTGTSTLPVYIERNGAANPFDGFDVENTNTPDFSDIDGDGDQDVIIGNGDGNLFYLENTGTSVAPSYIMRTGAANPFDGIDIGDWSHPILNDIDGDGDQDLVIGGFRWQSLLL